MENPNCYCAHLQRGATADRLLKERGAYLDSLSISGNSLAILGADPSPEIVERCTDGFAKGCHESA
jgi:hypothetical protein